jgi:hypothetical protein
MEKQHYGNHRKKAPLIYYLSLAILLVNIFIWIGSFIVVDDSENKLSYLLLSLVCFATLVLGYFARALALKAQDRAIRAEENLRHFVLTGKLHDSRLSLSQVIALRFASDDEFVELSKKAAEQNMKPVDIKKQIKNWREDHNRV